MTDIRPTRSGGGRIFGGDRRLRPHSNQALKCPRCESLNTKFCYYNNYNLSQACHFCKNCRRYWTKGGVLRNVPVGGGCRKTKRAKSKSSQDVLKLRKYSSSESSSLTATTPTEPASSSSASALLNYFDSSLFNGSFTSLMTASNFTDSSPFRMHQQQQQKMTSMVEE
ncbi:hypothetical protein HHK36_029880 [Tetracentron sinense]|uniref:Dof zinc finger protein n=1 Tax=Tetracentron sinense TaxID=13715 RepID=A0A835D004_TETSI|nr:hypothetical protein HHK36_029880 [Tetracentron sinense]